METFSRSTIPNSITLVSIVPTRAMVTAMLVETIEALIVLAMVVVNRQLEQQLAKCMDRWNKPAIQQLPGVDIAPLRMVTIARVAMVMMLTHKLTNSKTPLSEVLAGKLIINVYTHLSSMTSLCFYSYGRGSQPQQQSSYYSGR